jgi:hypothetical protein
VQLPKAQEEVLDAEEVVDEGSGGGDEFGLQNMSEDDAYGGPAEDERRPCPMCGEMIISSAAKCRYCGEVFDATLKRKEKKSRKKSGGDSDDDTPTTSDWVITFLCPGIACIGSIVYLIQGKKKGLIMLGVSIGMSIFWNIVFTVIGQMAK